MRVLTDQSVCLKPCGQHLYHWPAIQVDVTIQVCVHSRWIVTLILADVNPAIRNTIRINTIFADLFSHSKDTGKSLKLIYAKDTGHIIHHALDLQLCLIALSSEPLTVKALSRPVATSPVGPVPTGPLFGAPTISFKTHFCAR